MSSANRSFSNPSSSHPSVAHPVIPAPSRRHRTRAWFVVSLLALIVLGAAAGCSGGDDPDSGSGATPEARGKDFASSNGCVSCHSDDGSEKAGPTWKGVWGTDVELEDGSSVTFDEAYLRRSIEDPSAEIVKGFDPVMPSGSIDQSELDDLAAYIQSLA